VHAAQNDELPELYTVYEWHVVDGNRVVVHMQNRRVAS
jgi:ribosomal silencing factor RsfS